MTIDDCPGKGNVEYTLLTQLAPLVGIFLDAVLRHVWTGGVVILDVAQRRRTRGLEPLFHPCQVAHACSMRQIVGYFPDASKYRNDVCVRIRERELDRLRWRWRLTPEDSGIQIEKRCDELRATVQRCSPDEPC